jgi:hypothetical protein
MLVLLMGASWDVCAQSIASDSMIYIASVEKIGLDYYLDNLRTCNVAVLMERIH